MMLGKQSTSNVCHVGGDSDTCLSYVEAIVEEMLMHLDSINSYVGEYYYLVMVEGLTATD
jgi:hypothetical protein